MQNTVKISTVFQIFLTLYGAYLGNSLADPRDFGLAGLVLLPYYIIVGSIVGSLAGFGLATLILNVIQALDDVLGGIKP